MREASGSLTVYFEDPFWVGVFEEIENGALSVCKVAFGAEPKDDEVWAYILRYFGKLQFSPAIKIEERRRADHPKRRQRSITKQLQTTGIGTKSQQALAAQREAGKAERKKVSKAQREAAQQRKFVLRQQKRKKKHRGH